MFAFLNACLYAVGLIAFAAICYLPFYLVSMTKDDHSQEQLRQALNDACEANK